MADDKSSIRINLKDGNFEIEGSEAFVTQTLGVLREIIRETNHLVSSSSETEGGPFVTPAPHHNPDNTNPYPKVVDMNGDAITVIKAMPGSSKAEKTVNATLVFLWAKNHKGFDLVPSSEIRDVCKRLSCLDEKNFAAHLKGAKEFFIDQGKQGSPDKRYRLTVPGLSKAEDLLRSLNE